MKGGAIEEERRKRRWRKREERKGYCYRRCWNRSLL